MTAWNATSGAGPVESFEPGMILDRRGIGSVEVVNPSGGGSHAAFARRVAKSGAAQDAARLAAFEIAATGAAGAPSEARSAPD